MARSDRKFDLARDARVSIHHPVVAPMLWGEFGVQELAPERVFSAEAGAMRANVSAYLDPDLPPMASRVVVEMTDGQRLEATVFRAHGSPASPLSDHELEHTAWELAGFSSCGVDVKKFLNNAWHLDQASSIAEFAHSLGTA